MIVVNNHDILYHGVPNDDLIIIIVNISVTLRLMIVIIAYVQNDAHCILLETKRLSCVLYKICTMLVTTNDKIITSLLCEIQNNTC